MAKKQSAKDRLQRLNKGCCPIHGCKMIYAEDVTELCGCYKEFTVGILAGCPRKNCGISATAPRMSGPWRIEEEFIHVLGGECEA